MPTYQNSLKKEALIDEIRRFRRFFLSISLEIDRLPETEGLPETENNKNLKTHVDQLMELMRLCATQAEPVDSREDLEKMLKVSVATADLLVAVGFGSLFTENNSPAHHMNQKPLHIQLQEYRQMAMHAQVSTFSLLQKMGIVMMAIAVVIACIALCVAMPPVVPLLACTTLGLAGLGLFTLNKQKGLSDQGLSKKMTNIADDLEVKSSSVKRGPNL